jgi:hypothetical protein
MCGRNLTELFDDAANLTDRAIAYAEADNPGCIKVFTDQAEQVEARIERRFETADICEKIQALGPAERLDQAKERLADVVMGRILEQSIGGLLEALGGADNVMVIRV